MRDEAVSAVLSEVLMIALVLILVPIVTISLMNQLPEDRVPTVTILMKVNMTDDILNNLSFYHKGGDYLKRDDLFIIIRVKELDGSMHEYGSYHRNDLIFDPPDYQSQVFDLSHSVKTPAINQKLTKGSIISASMISKNSVVFPGEYPYEG